ncbi:GAF and ANTAR domain-containing protein [Egicoccus halophilus]|uniref:GAF and ANTAR domain-containing protein n=1 Tax=Egicoccus halophilus TaxID=1670830 RepID=UPI0013EE7F78|nr:GAF and ANTAR domain-containing protein [Egicoccus halophilus]
MDRAYLATLEELTGLLVEEATLEGLLSQVLELTARAVATSAAVSVTVVDEHGRYRTAARSSEDAELVDVVQYELVQGPCVEALERGEERYVADFGTNERWPEVAERARQLGFGCVLAVPLSVNGVVIGALNVFGASVDGLSTADRELVRRIAAPAASTLANARAFLRVHRLAEQLQEALASRVVIEQAKGVLMAREGCDADTAFELLRRTSQDANRRLREVARAIVVRHEAAARGRDGG